MRAPLCLLLLNRTENLFFFPENVSFSAAGTGGSCLSGKKGSDRHGVGRGNEEGSSGRERPKGSLGINPFLSLELTGLEIVPLATERGPNHTSGENSPVFLELFQ